MLPQGPRFFESMSWRAPSQGHKKRTSQTALEGTATLEGCSGKVSTPLPKLMPDPPAHHNRLSGGSLLLVPWSRGQWSQCVEARGGNRVTKGGVFPSGLRRPPPICGGPSECASIWHGQLICRVIGDTVVLHSGQPVSLKIRPQNPNSNILYPTLPCSTLIKTFDWDGAESLWFS